MDSSCGGMYSHLVSEQEGTSNHMWAMCLSDRNDYDLLIHQEGSQSNSFGFTRLHDVGIKSIK